MNKVSQSKQKLQSLDVLIEQKCGTGYYQLITLIIVVFIDFNDGAEQILMSLLIPILTKEWKLNSYQITTLASIFYIGMVFGSFLSGKVADKKGRRISIMFSCLLQFITAISFAFITGYQLAMIVRFIYGFVYGFSIPLTTTMVSEVTQQKHRGRFIVIVNFFVTVGKMYAFLLAAIFLDDLNTGNWRKMMVMSSFTSLLVLIATKLLLFESPRFLIASGRTQEGLQIIDEIIHLNQTRTPQFIQYMFGTIPHTPLQINQADGMKYGYISLLDQIYVENWAKETFIQNTKGSYSALLSKNYLPITLRLWLIWFGLNFVYFGQIIILPFVLGKQEKSLRSYFITVLGEVPSILVSLLIIEIEFFGRKNTMALSFFLTGVLSYLGYHYFNQITFFVTLNSIMRFFLKECWAMIYPYTTESYNTLQRALGFGTAAGIGRIGSSISPYILIPLYQSELKSPWLSFCLACIICSVACITLPYDTTGRNLDLQEQKEIEMLRQDNYIEQIKTELQFKLLSSPQRQQRK